MLIDFANRFHDIDFKSSFLPFMLQGEDVELYKRGKQRGATYSRELKRVIDVLSDRMKLQLAKRIELVKKNVETVKQNVKENVESVRTTVSEKVESWKYTLVHVHVLHTCTYIHVHTYMYTCTCMHHHK